MGWPGNVSLQHMWAQLCNNNKLCIKFPSEDGCSYRHDVDVPGPPAEYPS